MSKLDDLTKKVAALKKGEKKVAQPQEETDTTKKAPTGKNAKPAPADGQPLAPLEPRQERFCQEYLIDLNGTQAAIRAGYSAKTANTTASQNLAKRNIQARVQELFNLRAKRVQVDQDYVLITIIDTIERCKQTVRPVINKAGEHQLTETPTGEGLAYVFDAGNTLRGAELLGKHLKMFTDKVEHTGKEGGPIETITATMDPRRAAEIYKEMMHGHG